MNNFKNPQVITRLVLLLSFVLILVACISPQVVPGTAPPTVINRPINTSTPKPAPEPTSTYTPAPTPASSELVWFAPNMGSADYTQLFTSPELWQTARSRINVFKFYTQNVLDSTCSICGDNLLSAFAKVDAFRKLSEWGIAISLEVGAVKEWGCTGTEEFRVAKTAIQNIQANGGTVVFLDMDEPYIGGELVANGNTCGYTMEESADITSQFIQQVTDAYPIILVGDTEPYPYFTVPELELWLDALIQRGANLAHFHLDVDMVRARNEERDVSADLQRLSLFLQDRSIPFGVIFTSNLNWTPASDCAYFNATTEWIRIVDAAIGKPQHILFQSWLGPSENGIHKVPVNLPEIDTGSCSHTHLILQGLELFSD